MREISKNTQINQYFENFSLLLLSYHFRYDEIRLFNLMTAHAPYSRLYWYAIKWLIQSFVEVNKLNQKPRIGTSNVPPLLH